MWEVDRKQVINLDGLSCTYMINSNAIIYLVISNLNDNELVKGCNTTFGRSLATYIIGDLQN